MTVKVLFEDKCETHPPTWQTCKMQLTCTLYHETIAHFSPLFSQDSTITVEAITMIETQRSCDIAFTTQNFECLSIPSFNAAHVIIKRTIHHQKSN